MLTCSQLSSSSAQPRGSAQPSSQLEPAQFAQLNLVQPGAAQVSGSSIAVSSGPAQLCGAVHSNRVRSASQPILLSEAGLVQPGATQLRCCSPPASSAPAQQPRSTQLNGSSTEVSSTLRLCSVQPSSQLEPAQFAQLSLVQHGAAQLSGCSTAVSSAPTQLSGAVQSNRVHNSSQLSLLRST